MSQTSRPECRRQHPRQRTRLRAGKLTDLGDHFLADCTIFDISEGGVGLLVPEHIALPEKILIFDEREQTIAMAHIRWRKGNQLGIAFEIEPTPIEDISATRLQALRHKYYAVD